MSLAQAWLYYDETRCLAVMNDDEVVGFLMLDWDEAERTVGIWRFMIAIDFQGKGYGRKAMEAAVALIREDGHFDLIHLDYVEGNDVARKLYYSIGFRENGKVEGKEIIMTLPLTDAPKVGMLTADEEDMEEFMPKLYLEKEQGVTVPEIFTQEAVLKKALEEEKITRFSRLGETIGIAYQDTIFMLRDYSQCEKEARIKYYNQEK